MRWVGLLSLFAALAVLLLSFPAPSFPGVSGIVLGSHGPEPGTVVRWQGTSLHALSDTRGHFALPRPNEPRRLTAWKEGYFIAGRDARSPFGVVHLTPLPASDDESYTWVDPTPDLHDTQRCGNCHREMYREWSRSAHGRSVTGIHFLDLYAGSKETGKQWSLLEEHPGGSGVCASCHAPTVREDDPALYDLRKVRGVDRQGVHCDYCHKIGGPGEGEVGLTHGRFGLRLLRPGHGQLFFGPLDDVDRGEDAYSPFMRESRYCASCHEGIVFGVHVYSTFSEWQASPAGRAGVSCQRCHMKPTGEMTNIAPGRGGIERNPATLGNHSFWDGSQAAMLRRSLDLRVETKRDKGDVVATIRLTANNVGHRVPTGFIDRQLILSVAGLDSHNRALSASAGPRLPASVGEALSNQPGRLYARVLRDEKGQSPVPFWRAEPEFVDTRLRPEVPDLIRFRFPASTATLRVQVRHRRFWDETRRKKQWEDSDIIVIDRRVRCR